MPVKNVAVSAIGLGKGKGQEVDVGDSSEEEDEEAEVEQTVGTPFQAEATPFGETKEQATKRRARNGEGARAQCGLSFPFLDIIWSTLTTQTNAVSTLQLSCTFWGGWGCNYAH